MGGTTSTQLTEITNNLLNQSVTNVLNESKNLLASNFPSKVYPLTSPVPISLLFLRTAFFISFNVFAILLSTYENFINHVFVTI